MADTWISTTLDDVRPGDRVRFRGGEFVVARVDDKFLGRDGMKCLIEDTPERWHAYPGASTAEVEVCREA
jgi:hypothetical protein